MIKLLLALLAVGQVATVKPTVVNPNEWSYYDVIRAPGSVTVDGMIGDKEWGRAPAISSFADIFNPQRPVRQPTTAKLMWDDHYLYAAFECADEDIWGTLTDFDGFIFLEEVVEVYIDPEGCGRHYWEIEVSPRNVVLDLMTPRAGEEVWANTNKRYDVKGLLTAVKVYGTLDNRADKDEGWAVEIAIPWSDFAGRKVNVPPKGGDSWRLQLFRIDRPNGAEPQIVSWSKSPGVFHQPKNFGVVTFRR